MTQLVSRHKSRSGFAVIEAVIALAAFAAVVLVGFFVFHIGHHAMGQTTVTSIVHTTKATKQSTNAYAILSPATVPSKVPECSQQLTYASDGDSSPIQCADGDLNVLEWNALATLEPSVMTLGYSATASEVQSALCKDASDSNSDANTSAANVIEATTYQITALYYGWNFTSDPSAVLSNGGC